MALIFLILISSVASAKEVVCSKNSINRASRIAFNRSHNDKNMHCVASCLLALTCRPSSVLVLGYLKEVRDIVTPGDADWQDITADRLGIGFVQSKRAKNGRECLEQCDQYYSPR